MEHMVGQVSWERGDGPEHLGVKLLDSNLGQGDGGRDHGREVGLSHGTHGGNGIFLPPQ